MSLRPCLSGCSFLLSFSVLLFIFDLRQDQSVKISLLYSLGDSQVLKLSGKICK